jgi:hypothetical protein
MRAVGLNDIKKPRCDSVRSGMVECIILYDYFQEIGNGSLDSS